MYEVEYYVAANGKSPFLKWLKGLDRQVQSRILMRIDRVKQGNLGDCKSVGSGIYELRMFFGSGYRIYFAIENKKIVIVLSAGDKNSQSADIIEAKQYYADYREFNYGKK